MLLLTKTLTYRLYWIFWWLVVFLSGYSVVSWGCFKLFGTVAPAGSLLIAHLNHTFIHNKLSKDPLDGNVAFTSRTIAPLVIKCNVYASGSVSSGFGAGTQPLQKAWFVPFHPPQHYPHDLFSISSFWLLFLFPYSYLHIPLSLRHKLWKQRKISINAHLKPM